MRPDEQHSDLKYTVFIHVNHKQWLGAVVGKYALEKHSSHTDKFDVQFIEVKDQPFLHAREGQLYLRDGDQRRWLNNDLQSFTPLRFMPPELMGYTGRAVVIDPDVFAVADVWELLNRELQGSAMMCRAKSGNKGKRGALASSVMLLDSDQGSQYAAADYRATLAEHGIECSMSRKGCCWDNAVAESFFHTLKTELVHHEDYGSRAAAKASIFEYIEVFYNRQRRHSHIGQVAPLVFESAALAAS